MSKANFLPLCNHKIARIQAAKGKHLQEHTSVLITNMRKETSAYYEAAHNNGKRLHQIIQLS